MKKTPEKLSLVHATSLENRITPGPTPRFGNGPPAEASTHATHGRKVRHVDREAIRPPKNLKSAPVAPITLSEAANAYVMWHERQANPEQRGDRSSHTRVMFWIECLGEMPMNEITQDHVTACRQWLIQRGAMRFHRVGKSGGKLEPLDRPLSNGSINRHVATLGSIFKFAHMHSLLSATVHTPIAGIRRLREGDNTGLAIRETDLERLLVAARAVDRKWGKLCALLMLAFYSGVRRGNLESLRWAQLDLKARTIAVGRTKNGSPILTPLPDVVVAELKRLPGTKATDAKVFCHTNPALCHDFNRLWDKVREMTGLTDRVFHSLRHGYGSTLASRGTNQAVIKDLMAHKSLAASERYMHLDATDKRAAIERAFAA